MKTLLDDFHTWFLHTAIYAEGDLRIIVAEGFRAAEPEDINILGHVIKDTQRIDTNERSRMFSIRFTRMVAWQLVVESFTAFDEYEQRDDTGTLQTLSRSKYFDYVRGSHGWYEDMIGPAKHYRVWTENEVVDVVACESPVIQPWTRGDTKN